MREGSPELAKLRRRLIGIGGLDDQGEHRRGPEPHELLGSALPSRGALVSHYEPGPVDPRPAGERTCPLLDELARPPGQRQLPSELLTDLAQEQAYVRSGAATGCDEPAGSEGKREFPLRGHEVVSDLGEQPGVDEDLEEPLNWAGMEVLLEELKRLVALLTA